MKKVLFVLSLILFTSISSVKGQIVNLLNENFNNGVPAGWTLMNVDGLTPNTAVSFVDAAWVSREDGDSTGIGDSVIVATSYYSPAGSANDWIILPQVTLEGNGNFLTWQARSIDPSYADGYAVYISNSLPTIDSFAVNDVLYTTDGEFPYWKDRSVSLDSFASQSIYIAFRLKSNDKFLLELDNIRIYADTLTSINETAATIVADVAIYPNPARENIQIHSDVAIELVCIYSISGGLIQALNINRQRNFIYSLSEIPEGIYIIELTDENNNRIRKKIIRN